MSLFGGFEFSTAARVIFGAGAVTQLPEIVAELGSRVLVCTGKRPDRHAAVLDILGLPFEVITVAGEPTVVGTRRAFAHAREFGADVVLAVGGGSVMDLGKALAMLLGNGGDPLDYLEVVGRGQPISRPSAPLVAVPTTAGSGAEVTANAVLVSPEHDRKASLRARSMLPAVALVDPLLTLSCGPAVTAASGLDALTQCLEPFVSPAATPISDLYAADGLRRAARALPALHDDPGDVEARTDMSLAALFGGIALANAKLGAVHALAGVIGGMVSAPHGALCAALLAPVIEVNVRRLRHETPESLALQRYQDAARLLTGSPRAAVTDGVQWIRETVQRLGIGSLASLGVPVDDAATVARIAAAAASASSMRGNPVALTGEDLRGCLRP